MRAVAAAIISGTHTAGGLTMLGDPLTKTTTRPFRFRRRRRHGSSAGGTRGGGRGGGNVRVECVLVMEGSGTVSFATKTCFRQ